MIFHSFLSTFGVVIAFMILNCYIYYADRPIPPSFARKLKPTSGALNTPIIFSCKIAGSVPISISWLKNETEISEGDKFKISFEDGIATLAIGKLENSDERGRRGDSRRQKDQSERERHRDTQRLSLTMGDTNDPREIPMREGVRGREREGEGERETQPHHGRYQ